MLASTFTSGVFAQVNSLAGSAILSMSDMKPGDSVTGVVGIANDGDLAGAFTLSSETESSQPGLGGGDLRSILQLTVTDLTSGATVYSGSLAGLVSRPVGVFAAGDAHSYRFTVTLPDRGGAESAVAGASASVRCPKSITHKRTARPRSSSPRNFVRFTTSQYRRFARSSLFASRSSSTNPAHRGNAPSNCFIDSLK